jgi:hypothetical protein
MQSNAPDGLTFMSTCLFDLGLDTFLFVPYLLLCYYAYLDVSCFLLQPRLSSIFAVQPGKEFTVSLRLLANVYCWYIVGVIFTKRLAEGTLIDNDSIQICLYLLSRQQAMQNNSNARRRAPRRFTDPTSPPPPPPGRGRSVAASSSGQASHRSSPSLAAQAFAPPPISGDKIEIELWTTKGISVTKDLNIFSDSALDCAENKLPSGDERVLPGDVQSATTPAGIVASSDDGNIELNNDVEVMSGFGDRVAIPTTQSITEPAGDTPAIASTNWDVLVPTQITDEIFVNLLSDVVDQLELICNNRPVCERTCR